MFFQAPTLHGDKTKLSYAYKSMILSQMTILVKSISHFDEAFILRMKIPCLWSEFRETAFIPILWFVLLGTWQSFA